MMTAMKWIPIVCVLLLAGCSSDSPTAPTPTATPPPVVVSPPSPTIPTINGQWTGTYTVTGCTTTGSAVGTGVCLPTGTIATHVFTPQQSGGNLSGNMTIGGFVVPVTGNVGTDNVVSLSGSGPVAGATLSVTTWRSTVSGSTMSGTMMFSLVIANPIGSATFTATTALAR